MKEDQLIPHLFRIEYSKLVAVLCKTYGLQNIQLAEDIASQTFLKATETWGLKGTPSNPKAWLYAVAKNTLKDHFKREKIFKEKITPNLKEETSFTPIDLDLSEQNIVDSQLQMLFAVCDPRIAMEGQVVLALRVLAGLSIEEIAAALLTNKAVINKRLYRAKQSFIKHDIALSLPSTTAINERLDYVLTIIYLIYNEGYFATSQEVKIRKDLCIEAMRLLMLLLDYPSTNLPKANALMALFCFQASRFDARVDLDNQQVLYADQDPQLWNQELIAKGQKYLKLSGTQSNYSKYHLEAYLAFLHTDTTMKSTLKWESVLQIYNRLLQIDYSPMVALNRTYALSKVKGKEVAIQEALKIDLNQHHLYHTLLAELYNEVDKVKQLKHLNIAKELCISASDSAMIEKKIRNLDQQAF